MVVVLHDIQGMPHEEIARIMDCNTGTVRSRLFYARQQLQATPFRLSEMTCMLPPDDAEQRLLRLLALKRHEVPPPGFFDQLPVRILVNLRAGSEIEDIPWWTRAWRMVIQEPMIGLSYAALGVGAVLFGVSVLETAIDVQSPPVGLSQGILSSSTTDLIFADPARVPRRG
ncbi:MAG: sigma factor-like helix-turn-helix DNA-binding protein [Cypionkella sp.]